MRWPILWSRMSLQICGKINLKFTCLFSLKARMDISPYIQHEMVIFGWQSVLYMRIALYVQLEI